MRSQRRRLVLLAVLLVGLVWGTGCATGKAPQAIVAPPITENDIVYATVSDVRLMMDIAYPSGGRGPYPLVVFFCGNGWGYYSSQNRKQYTYPLGTVAQRGYVAATVDVRYTALKEGGKALYRFPDQVSDAKCAIRWLRANSDRFGIDADRIGVIGWSSGGYLSLMLGLTDPSDGLEGDCGDLSISSKVQAVVSIAGPTELTSLYRETTNPICTSDFMGGTPDELPEPYHRASPLSYVSEDDPPVLTVHGKEDDLVPLNQASVLDLKMNEVGATHILVIKDGFKHFNLYNEPAIWEFMDRHLKVGK